MQCRRDDLMRHAPALFKFDGDAEIVFNRNRQESQMYSSLTAVVLCIAMQTAAAQCTAPVPVAANTTANTAAHTRTSGDLIKKKQAVAAPVAHAGGELIKTASAGTHDEVRGLPRSAPVATAQEQDDEHRRGGPAMLLAALALMSGIALRRFGAHKQ
jgi:hypothetical protein